MKRLIKSSADLQIKKSIDAIDIIVIVNDARSQGLKHLPIVASTNEFEDYDQMDIDELMWLTDRELRSIQSPYALDKIATAIRECSDEFSYRFTPKQQDILHDYYKNRENSEVVLYEEDVNNIIKLIRECDTIIPPTYRASQPEKNFAKMHGLKMVDDDYAAIVKSLKPSECIGAVKSSVTSRLGALLYEFIHDPKGYKLKYSDQVIDDEIKIYIKVIPEYEQKLTIAIVSFHDPLD